MLLRPPPSEASRNASDSDFKSDMDSTKLPVPVVYARTFPLDFNVELKRNRVELEEAENKD